MREAGDAAQQPLSGGATVLVVDDEASVREFFAAALAQGGYRVREAASGPAALEALTAGDVDVALVDVEMPGLSGIELTSRIREDPRNESIAIMLVSGDGALERKLAGLEAGASDYLVKPVALRELLARVAAQLRDRSRWLQRLDRQLAARSRLARRIAELDPLVPLRAMERDLLRVLSAELALRELTIEVATPQEGDAPLSIRTLAQGARVRVPLRFAGVPVGVLDAVVDGEPERTVPTLGDLAPQLGAVIAGGIGRNESSHEARRWVEGLVAEGALSPVFQPIVTLADGRVVGFEGLTRFANGTRPDIAFALAAQHGISPELEAAAVTCILAGADALPTGAWVSVNVSPATLLTGSIDEHIRASRRELVLELTENEHVGDYAAIRDRLGSLPGLRLAVDDAGAGYASLRHVFELRPNLVKLDRSWIAEIDGDPARLALVHGLIGFSTAFGARLVAEGVERPEEAAALRDLGVPLAQGYLFGAPSAAQTWADGGGAG